MYFKTEQISKMLYFLQKRKRNRQLFFVRHAFFTSLYSFLLGNLVRVESILASYKENDYDFGIDGAIVSGLLEVSMDHATALVDALSRGQNNIVNALSLICGLACLAEKDSLMIEERCSCSITIFYIISSFFFFFLSIFPFFFF